MPEIKLQVFSRIFLTLRSCLRNIYDQIRSEFLLRISFDPTQILIRFFITVGHGFSFNIYSKLFSALHFRQVILHPTRTYFLGISRFWIASDFEIYPTLFSFPSSASSPPSSRSPCPTLPLPPSPPP